MRLGRPTDPAVPSMQNQAPEGECAYSQGRVDNVVWTRVTGRTRRKLWRCLYVSGCLLPRLRRCFPPVIHVLRIVLKAVFCLSLTPSQLKRGCSSSLSLSLKQTAVVKWLPCDSCLFSRPRPGGKVSSLNSLQRHRALAPFSSQLPPLKFFFLVAEKRAGLC